MKRKFSSTFGRAIPLLLLASLLLAETPLTLNPPSDETKLVQVHGIGDQIYSCKENAWIFKAPDAQLLSAANEIVGRHFAGPTWQWNDQSTIVGKVTANVPSPESSSIPWLLLTVARHQGEGFLSRVISIQRLNTKGGKAPATSCDSSHTGDERVHYEADYVFYTKDK